MTHTRILLILLLAGCLSGCQQRSRLTPWGTVIGDTAEQVQHFSMDEMLMQGEMILLTLSGPDTYYDYHGRGMGLQFQLCQQFANQLGVSLRVDLCKDTTELFTRLRRGEGDIGIVRGAAANDTTKTEAARKADTGRQHDKLTRVAVGGTAWYVYTDNTELATALDDWYDDSCLALAEEAERYGRLPQPRSYSFEAPLLNERKGMISRYDHLFQRYASTVGVDWRLLAALSYQESRFDPMAQSWAGAKGLMQLMPATARKLGISDYEIFDPATNISGGARTLRSLLTLFMDIPPGDERLRFALAAYNGGSGHIRDAMKLAHKHGDNHRRWDVVAQYVLKLSLPEYFNDPVVSYGYMRGNETYDYVNLVMQRYNIYRNKGLVNPSAQAQGQQSPSAPSYDDNRTPRRATGTHRFQL